MAPAMQESKSGQTALRSQFVNRVARLALIHLARLADHARVQSVFPNNTKFTRDACIGISAGLFLGGRFPDGRRPGFLDSGDLSVRLFFFSDRVVKRRHDGGARRDES
jgi:hypothetical protein